MKDVQNGSDERGIAIQKVGIKELYLPFYIETKFKSAQPVLSKIKFTVDLPMEYKGTHMSRFVEILNEWNQKSLSMYEMECILEHALNKLEASSAYLKIDFKYFINKIAPISKRKSILDIDCAYIAQKDHLGNFEFILEVNVPFTSLCPCSKEISKYGAHNQRGLMHAKVKLERNKILWIEDLVEIMEKQASCPIYPLLKREDEKFVTEKAYENPKFVEDILRDLVLAFRKINFMNWFSIECENFESIHNHSAYASHSEFVRHSSSEDNL